VFSFAQESSRYCNYSSNKFEKNVTFILPCWLVGMEGSDIYNYFTRFLEVAE
jgi:thymidylate synthase (FAD)